MRIYISSYSSDCTYFKCQYDITLVYKTNNYAKRRRKRCVCNLAFFIGNHHDSSSFICCAVKGVTMHFCKIDAAFAAESLSIAGVQTLFFLFEV